MIFRRPVSILCTSALAMMALLHCKGSTSEPSKTPADSSGTAQMNGSSGSNDSDSSALDDAQIAAITDAANSAEVEQGRLAQSKATDSRVRTFAAMMVDHHSEARREQQGLSVAKVDNAESQRLAREADNALQSLQQKSGQDFDREYVRLQCEEHRKVLDTLQSKLLPAAKGPALRAYLEKLKPKVEAHLAQAERLQQELGASDGKSSQSSKESSGDARASSR
jgi:putative membrane protein